MGGEAKAQLGRSDIVSELDKSRKFKALRSRNLSRLFNVVGHSDWLSYYIYYRPYFIMAMESKSNWNTILYELMNYIDKKKKIPLDAIFLIDKGIVILISPCGPFPGAEATGIPFEHLVQGVAQTGAIHIFKTDIPLALFMAWLGQFHTSFMSDRIPIGEYLQDTINSSMSGAQIAVGPMDFEALKKLHETKGLFGGTLEFLRSAVG